MLGRKRQIHAVPNCLNCGEPIQGAYCYVCGQEAVDETVSFRHLAGEALDQVAGLDAKLLRTLLPLAVRPGFLTNEYNAGRRVRYLSPFRLYFYVSVIFFLIVTWKTVPESSATFGLEEARLQTLQALQKAKSQPGAVKTQTVKRGVVIGFNASDAETQRFLVSLPHDLSEYDARQRDPKNLQKDSPGKRFFTRQLLKAQALGPRGLTEKFTDNAPRMMFLLLPLFALLLKIIYLRRNRLYIEHLIFALHSHAFVFLAFSLMALLPNAPPLVSLLALTIPIYLFVAMKRVYRQSYLKTGVKFLLLAFAYALVFCLFLLATLAATFALI